MRSQPTMSARTASRIPADLGGSAWYEMLPPPGPARRLEGRLEADWAVVGAGFAGLAAARRLRQLRPRDRIVVLDAQRVGWGASGRNSGFMIDLPHELNSENYAGGTEHDRRQIRMNRAGIAFAAQAAEEYGLQAFFDRCGKYHGAATPRGLAALDAFEAHIGALGETYSRLDAKAMKELTGSEYYLGGTFTPGAVMIQPAGFIRGVAAGLSHGVEIFEESPVTSIESGPTGQVVATAQGQVHAPKLILTVNGHAESFGFAARRLMHIFLYASMTRRLSEEENRRLGGEAAWGLTPADPMGSTVRRLREGRILVRNVFTWNPGMAASREQVARAGRRHDRSFRARFPQLAGVAMEYRWAGHLCLSLNSAPLFGEVAENIFSACCCNGLGTVKGTLYGMLAAELAAGEPGPLVAEALAEPEPRRLYPEPLMTAGARARLWYMQKRAGREL